MEYCLGEVRVRVRICVVARRRLCWLALLCACFRVDCWCCVHPQCVLSSLWWSARDCHCPRISDEEEGAIGSFGAVRWRKRSVASPCPVLASPHQCIVSCCEGICTVMREVLVSCWLTQHVVRGRVECLLDSSRCGGVTGCHNGGFHSQEEGHQSPFCWY